MTPRWQTDFSERSGGGDAGRIRRIHFIGIGGSGMCGIAELLLDQGYQISGSDLTENEATRRLRELGASVAIGHAREHVEDSHVVVRSSAVPDDNVELLGARERRIPTLSRAEMLSELMRFRRGIAVAGAHGKTTTTSMIASIFSAAGLDPTFVIGGRLKRLGVHGRLGGDHIIVEADESDISFLHLQPLVAVVTNMDAEHMDAYQGNFKLLRQAFLDFLHNLPFYGLAVLCVDDSSLADMLADIARLTYTYGFGEQADYRIADYRQQDMRCAFTLSRPDAGDLRLSLQVPGRHNALNAAAAAVVADRYPEIDDRALCAGLENFHGVDRRLHFHGEFPVGDGAAMLFDDYGHHPTEIQVTVDALRGSWPNRRIVMVFQPHRFSRTRDLYDDFVRVLCDMDLLLMLEVYPATEEPIAGADSRSLCRSIRQLGKVDPVFIESADALEDMLGGMLRPGDIVLTQGAGDIGVLVTRLVAGFGVAPPSGPGSPP